MGYTIHEEITTKLHYKDIACITAAVYAYMETTGKSKGQDAEVVQRMNRLVDRLGREMADTGDEWNA